MFFSRRVGLDSDVVGGGRFTGQAGPISIGAMSLRTSDISEPGSVSNRLDSSSGAWNSVTRVRGNVLPRTTVGGIVTSKEKVAGHNRVAGADLQSRFWSSSSLLLWAAKVWDSDYAGSDGSNFAGQAELVLENDRYIFEITRTVIGEAFDPALGFVPRPDQKLSLIHI